MNTNSLSAAVERVISARHRLEQFNAHLKVALRYPRALTPLVRATEIEDAVERVALMVTDECQRARGTDALEVAAARARIDELSIVLDELCRELVLTEASA